MTKPLNILFLMDPLATVKFEKDTSFILMIGAHKRGHKVFFLGQGQTHRLDGKTLFDVQEVVPQMNPEKMFVIRDTKTLSEDNVDVIFVRTDPPFNEQYLFDTWLMSLLPSRITVINNPDGIRAVNEKVWVTQFTNIIPPTLVSRSKAMLLEFLKNHKDVIIKPTNAFGGRSIFRVKNDDVNRNAIIETMSEHQSREVIAQEFLEESSEGDKRIILLNGDPLGAVLRVHGPDDHRNNFFAGGSPQAATITGKEHKIIEILKPHLQKLGLYFVGIDVIGEKLIEVNVTSPTGLQEINRLNKQSLEDQVIAFAENLRKQNR